MQTENLPSTSHASMSSAAAASTSNSRPGTHSIYMGTMYALLRGCVSPMCSAYVINVSLTSRLLYKIS